MATPTPFKWVDQKQQRAPRIPVIEWVKRETRLRELYSQMTLSQLREVMDSEGFVATPKQYDYQFTKWGLQKYKISQKANEDSVDTGRVSGNPSSPAKDLICLLPDHVAKRPTSSLSTDSSSSGPPPSLLPKRKKLKACDEDTILRFTHTNLPPIPSARPSDIASPSGALTDGWTEADLREILTISSGSTDNKVGSSTAQ
ncbi:hypothetical protein PG984_006789 [Apiospora sp. TS-2023a]